MVRLTVDLIDSSAQFQNPIKDREIDLRDNKILQIENLGATRDLFETIDLSNNDIKVLEGFPLLKTLKTLLINNNRIITIADDLAERLPNLEDVILTNNNIQSLGEIHKLASLKRLTRLSLLKNPVTTTQNYRLYVIHKIPQLRVIDFERVKLKERKAALLEFGGVGGETKLAEIAKTFVPGGDVTMGTSDAAPKQMTHSAAQSLAIKAAIENARSLEEVQQIERDLMRGNVPGEPAPATAAAQ